MIIWIGLLVFLLAFLWTFPVYVLLLRPWKEKEEAGQSNHLAIFGVSLILAILAIGIVNYYSAIIFGGFATAFLMPLLPVFAMLIFWLWKRRRVMGIVKEILKSGRWYIAATFVLALFVLVPLSSKLNSGYIYGDMTLHIIQANDIAFKDAGNLPANPIAFPTLKPYVAFVGDSLAATVFRYMGKDVTPFHYSEILVVWVLLVWSSILFIVSSLWIGLFTLFLSLYIVPFLVWGYSGMIYFNWVSFYGNPNSALAYPIGLALAFFIFDCIHRRHYQALTAVLLLVPPASLFFKTNNAPAFWFVQVVGFVLYFLVAKKFQFKRVTLTALAAIVIWVLFYVMTTYIGDTPVGLVIHPSLQNLWHYSAVAFDSVGKRTGDMFFGDWFVYLAIILAIFFVGYWITNTLPAKVKSQFSENSPRSVLWLAALFIISALYIFIWWFVVQPTRGGDGEPMHVNFIVAMWISTLMLWSASFFLRVKLQRSSTYIAGTIFTVGLLLVILLFVPAKNIPGSKPRSLAAVKAIRSQLSGEIPEGHCYGYGRNFALFVDNATDTDFIGSATGCPIINGQDWGFIFNQKEAELDNYSKQKDLESEGGGIRKVVHYSAPLPILD